MSQDDFDAGRRYQRDVVQALEAAIGGSAQNAPAPSAQVDRHPDGGAGGLILVSCLPVVLEVVMLCLLAYGAISGMPGFLRLPSRVPTLGLHPILGLLAVFLVFCGYAFVHGSRTIAIVLGVVLTPWWAFWVHLAENPTLYASVRGSELLAGHGLSAVLPLLPKADWVWTTAVVVTALIGRVGFHRVSRDWYLSVTRVRTLAQARDVLANAGRTLLFFAVAAACLFGVFRACSSIVK